MGMSWKSADFLARSRVEDAYGTDPDSLFALGVSYSTGTDGVAMDLIEAHKWFNLAATAGLPEAIDARSDVADVMTARQIAEAQRQARAWLGTARARAA